MIDQLNLMGREFKVLDRGFVQLIDQMPHPATGVTADMAVVNAARVSYMGESKGEEADKKLLFYLMKNRHTTPFEQVQFKFRVKAPLVTLWQWVRHRTMSYNLQSGRYTPFEEDEFYVPSVWRKQSSRNKQGSEGEISDEDANLLTRTLQENYRQGYANYQAAIQMGVAREEARLFLPGFSPYYTMVCSVNSHNLLHFLGLRKAEDAQYEIRIYAQMIYDAILTPVMPWTVEAYETFYGS